MFYISYIINAFHALYIISINFNFERRNLKFEIRTSLMADVSCIK